MKVTIHNKKLPSAQYQGRKSEHNSYLLELPKQCEEHKAAWLNLTFLTSVNWGFWFRTRLRLRIWLRIRCSLPWDISYNMKYHK